MPVSLTVSVAVVRPGISSVGYSVPAAAIEYIELGASGYMDTTGRYQYVEDVVLMVDEASVAWIKALNDAASVNDAFSHRLPKALSDAISMADAEQHLLIFLRAFADSLLTDDSANRAATKALSDSVSLPETRSALIQKQISDLFSLNDTTGIGDGIAYLVSKTVSNVATTSDAVFMSSGATKADSFSLTEAGLIVKQDYCDITYFAEDYVGFAQSF